MPPPVALITGGEGTLALALHGEFSAAGWTVYAPGRDALDVTSSAAVQTCLRSLPGLDLLINCAGTTRDALLLSQSAEDRDSVIDVCLRGAFLCSREAARLMESRGCGHIVNIGSHSSLTGPAGQSAYAAAKAGLTALTKSLAIELGPAGIRVNCVLPGWFDSKMTRGASAAARARALEANVLRRFSTPGDAARFVLFLHSLSAVSGQVFCLDSRISRSGI
jgi:NAD(P)-dependent dehydrogenase (short-subunit alcohol dehydrogenase family)